MRRSTITGTLAALAVLTASAVGARTINFSTDTCKSDYSTPYDVDVTSSGLSFHRKDGTPAQIFLHDGTLRVDGKQVAVSQTDAEALRRYEDGVRKLVPQVATIAREGIQLGFAAMTTVTLSFADGDQRATMLEKLKRKQAQALREIDEGLGAGHWSGDRMEETIGGSISDSVGELVGSVTSSAVTAALSGDSSKVAALQARAESLEKSLDGEMNKRSKALEKRTDLICPQLNDLAELQHGWSIRQPDGKPLELMTVKPKGSDDHEDEAAKGGRKVASF
ncbi:DUF2884 family protein [Luteibacter sp. 9133]|uniref:DUF2884 family protein n=1 Tax=Luteibacter sp. 9133 TaxID=1500891 RepID=UPI0005BCB55C|nr:DUF2884 family protein [Luteibacter sp. 9133]